MSHRPQASKSKRNTYKKNQFMSEVKRTHRFDVTPDMSKRNRGFKCSIGEVLLIKLDGQGSVQKGTRPCVVVNINQVDNLLTVVPLTKQGVKYKNQIMIIDKCLRNPSVALCDTQRTVDKIQVVASWGRLEKQNFIRITNEIQKILSQSYSKQNRAWL